MRNKKAASVLAVILILALALCFTACGGSQGGNEGSSESGVETDSVNAKAPADLTEDDWLLADEGGEALTCNLGLKAAESGWTMEGSLAALKYSNLESEKDTLEKNMKDALASSGIEGFDFFTDYENDEISQEEAIEYGIDVSELLYTSGMEDEDIDKRVVEAGAYQNPQDGNYYQYTAYSSESYKSVEEINVSELCQLFEKAYGVTCDEQLMNDGFKAAYERAANYVEPEIPEVGEDEEDASEELSEDDSEEIVLEGEDEEALDEDSPLYDSEDMGDLEFDEEELYSDEYACTLQQTIEVEGEGYVDRVILNISAQKVDTEEVPGGAMIYASVERDRMYTK